MFVSAKVTEIRRLGKAMLVQLDNGQWIYYRKNDARLGQYCPLFGRAIELVVGDTVNVELGSVQPWDPSQSLASPENGEGYFPVVAELVSGGVT